MQSYKIQQKVTFIFELKIKTFCSVLPNKFCNMFCLDLSEIKSVCITDLL